MLIVARHLAINTSGPVTNDLFNKIYKVLLQERLKYQNWILERRISQLPRFNVASVASLLRYSQPASQSLCHPVGCMWTGRQPAKTGLFSFFFLIRQPKQPCPVFQPATNTLIMNDLYPGRQLLLPLLLSKSSTLPHVITFPSSTRKGTTQKEREREKENERGGKRMKEPN